MILFQLKKIVILVISICIATQGFSQKKKLTLEQIWGSGEFSAKTVSGFHPMNDGEHYAKMDWDSGYKYNVLRQYDYKTGKMQGTIAEEGWLKPENATNNLELGGYQFNSDETQLLVMNEVENIYRHSFKARYALLDRKTRKTNYISHEKGMHPAFNPKGNKIAWVRDNNLYLIDLNNMKETAITTDGKKDEIINGAVDWVYEEEFSMSSGFSWSPNGEKIAFFRFDETKVTEFFMPIYGGLYPKNETFKYPKAGEGNSLVTVWVYDLESKKTIQVDVGQVTDQYIPRIFWGNGDDDLFFFRMNRLQNKVELMKADADNGKSKVLLIDTSPDYVDLYDDVTFLNDGSFLWSSEKSGYKHLHHYDKNGKEIRQVTMGKFEVADLVGIDEKNNRIFYTSLETSPLDRNLYEIGIDGKNKKRITWAEGTNSVSAFSKNWKYFLNTNSTINSPYVVSLMDSTGKTLRILENNEKLMRKMMEYDLAPAKFLEVVTSEFLPLKGFIMVPSNFDEKKKYPVLQYVYGGPGSQQVLDVWKGGYYFWFNYLAQNGYIIMCVDNRGTGGRGESWKKITYRELGYYEIIDQIEVAKWLKKQPFVDSSRIGMFGWSFGGYMSSLAITKGAAEFKAAIAVAPVTNWRYYDNIYTERYMGLPKDNPNGYDDNSPTSHVDKIKGNFLIIHGTADDNVHFQNSVEMVDAMIKKNIRFDSEYYPNKNHGIGGGKTRLHLFTKMTEWMFKNL